MSHWIFFVNLAAFSSGVATLIALLLIFNRTRGRVFRDFFGVFICLLLISLMSIIDLYLEANLPLLRPEIKRGYFYLMAAVVAVFCFFLLRIYSAIFGESRSLRYLRRLFPFAAATAICADLVLNGGVLNFLRINALVTGACFLYVVFTPRRHMGKIADRTLRQYFHLSYALVALLLLLYAAKQWTADWGGVFAIFGRVHYSMFFFAHNLMVLFFTRRHFTIPARTETPNTVPGAIQLSEIFALRFGITPRERVIIREIIDGKSNREISRSVDVTEGTVKIFVHNIYKKTGVNSRMALAALVRQSPSNYYEKNLNPKRL